MHKNKMIPGFTKKYGLYKLVYYEKYPYVFNTIYREKCIKKWYRQWKIDLIEQMNPEWRDLYDDIIK